MPTKKRETKRDRREGRNRLRHPHTHAQLSYFSDATLNTIMISVTALNMRHILKKTLAIHKTEMSSKVIYPPDLGVSQSDGQN